MARGSQRNLGKERKARSHGTVRLTNAEPSRPESTLEPRGAPPRPPPRPPEGTEAEDFFDSIEAFASLGDDSSAAGGATFKIHLLDVNRERYGDAIVLELGSKTVLVDGAHPGDDKAKTDASPSLPEQFQEIFGRPGPYRFDLLVVTHTHRDHIGCLPAMVSAGTISADWVLAADEELGWGGPALDAEAAGPRLAAAMAGLREERPVFASKAELEAFLLDAMTLRQRYGKMLAALEEQGARIVRYGRDEVAALAEVFAADGLRILGPTPEHLEICRAAIEALGRDAMDFMAQKGGQDAQVSAGELLLSYLEARRATDATMDVFALDAASAGNAINCQSIVLAVERGGRRVLLTGDMQLADPRVNGLGPSMKELRRILQETGPYDMVKLPHHGAANGFNGGVLSETGTRVLTISTGPGSAKHPHPDVLELLGGLKDQLVWLRTDRNGRLTLDYSAAEGKVLWQRGKSNDLSRNLDPDAVPGERPVLVAPAAPALREREVPTLPAPPRPVLERSEQEQLVEVVVRVPRLPTRVTVTIDVQPLGEGSGTVGPEPPRKVPATRDAAMAPGPGPASGATRLAGGRPLPRLVFATDPDALAGAIGREARDRALAALRDAQQPLVVGSFAGQDPARVSGEIIPEAIRQQAEGIVLVGGYDVVPADIVNTLRPIYRKLVNRRNDPDHFYVWSDDIYGSIDDEAVADLPVSRIPDGHSGELLLTALQAARPEVLRVRAGLRNLLRPFAASIYDKLPGDEPCLVSHPTERRNFPGSSMGADVTYFMLHGSYRNAARFAGNTEDEEEVDAFGLENVRATPGAVVFTGCCWGALTVKSRAREHDMRTLPEVRSAGDSIGLAYLSQGANAFIGCTGAHYSPRVPPYNYASGPLHRYFFEALLDKALPPAKALWHAKQRYAAGMLTYPNPVDPAGPGAGTGAVERKLYAQFTCLGLGW